MTAVDRHYMDEAIALGWSARHSVSPRPWVGAVVVPTRGPGSHTGGYGGATEGRGGRHAEVVALQAAGDDSRGATLYCTLEPCSHHGATAPCADAVIEAGIARGLDLDGLQNELKCGTFCGGCLPEVKKIIVAKTSPQAA